MCSSLIGLKRLVVHVEKCAGCRHCEMVCSFFHEKIFNPCLSRITVFKEDKLGFDYPITCRQCSVCPPIELCTATALKKREGVIQIVNGMCIGCGTCVKSCNYGAVKLNVEGKPVICDLCGGKPKCVSRCPTGALEYIDVEEFSETLDEARHKLSKSWGIT